MIKWALFILGWVTIDVATWSIGLDKYLAVQAGAVILYISGKLNEA